jgi:exopolyphosphatase / guanosine-5'-triphosphate,3'-diphosphate pyrophosphatase
VTPPRGDTPPDPSGPAAAAVIDVGSNSVLLLVADGTRVLDEALETTRLGTGLADGGRLDAAARARTLAAVERLAARARARGARAVWAFGTAAMRRAADGAAFGREIEAACCVPVAVLTGEEEARLAYAAAAVDHPGGALFAVDVGGGTTELTLGQDARVVACTSLPLGALALTEAYLRSDPPAVAERARVEAAIGAALATTDLPARARAAGAAMVASGGTVSALGVLDLGLAAWDRERVHGHLLAYDRLAALVDRLCAMPAAARSALGAVDPERAAILPAGALVLAGVATAAGAGAVRVGERGVRHAYLAARLAAGEAA